MKNLAQSIPARWRTRLYTAIATLTAVETTLDGFDYGLVAERPQAAILAVLVVLGFGVAIGNVSSPTEAS